MRKKIVDTGERPDIVYSNPLDQQRYIHSLRYIDNNDRVLDFASGNGWGSRLIKLSGASYVCSVEKDISAKNLQHEFYKTEGVEHISDLELVEGTYNKIICLETIEHVDEPIEVLKKMHNLLKDDGLVVMSTPNGEISKQNNSDTPANPYHIDEYSKNEILQFLSESNFRIEEIFGLGKIYNRANEINKYQKFLKSFWFFNIYLQSKNRMLKILAKIYLKLFNISMIDPAVNLSFLPENTKDKDHNYNYAYLIYVFSKNR